MSAEDDDTKAILKRRARYVAMALAGIGTATQATACVCLSPIEVDAGSPPDTNVDAPRVPIDANLDAHFEFDIGPNPDANLEPDSDVDAD